MPKTLKKVNANATPQFTTTALSDNPKLAAMAMQVINAWSMVDSALAQILTLCLQAEFKTIAAILAALKSPQAQRDAILAGLESSFDTEDFKLVRAALSTTVESQNRRNQFAHHLWGASKDTPNCLLLINPKDFAAEFSKLIAMIVSGHKETDMTFDLSKVLVFTEHDLQEEMHAAFRAIRIAHRLGYLSLDARGTEEGDAIRDKLLRDPDIAQQLQSQSRQKPLPKKPK